MDTLTPTLTAPLLQNEAERLRALDEYEILDTEGEDAFDELTRLAAFVCGTPISTMTLIDEHRQWFKSKVGVGSQETSRDIARHRVLRARDQRQPCLHRTGRQAGPSVR
jgi:hypothetical protein